MGNSWSVLHASKCPLVTAVRRHLAPSRCSSPSLDKSVMEKLAGTASPKDIILFQSSLESRLATYFAALPHMDQANCQLEFHSNFQAIQVGVRNQFGYVKSGAEVGQGGAVGKQPPISRPSSAFNQIAPVKATKYQYVRYFYCFKWILLRGHFKKQAHKVRYLCSHSGSCT